MMPQKFFGLYSNPMSCIQTSGGTKFMLRESSTKHPSRSTADHIFKSVLCGRCGTVNGHHLLNMKLLEGGNATGVRQSSMLGFYGERVCRRRNQTCSLWEAQQAQLLSYQCTYIYIYILNPGDFRYKPTLFSSANHQH